MLKHTVANKSKWSKCKTSFGIWSFLIVGIVLAIWGLTYTAGFHHVEIVSIRRYYVKQISMDIYVRYAASDAFVAGQPVHVTINTSNVTDIDFLELTFDGADIYFPNNYNSNTTTNDSNLVEALKSSLTNVVPLLEDSNSYNNVTFSGKATLVYFQGGNFDIGITYRENNLAIEGYEEQQRDFKISAAVPVSPPENLLTIKTNQLMVGISWIAIAISIIVPALTKILLDRIRNTEKIETQSCSSKEHQVL